MSTVLTNGIIIPDNGSRNWGGDLANNWNILDVNVGYMNDVKNSVTTLETSVAKNTANIEINTSNISALQTSKQDAIEDLETIRAGATAGATAVQPSTLSNYVDLSSEQTITGAKTFSAGVNTISLNGKNLGALSLPNYTQSVTLSFAIDSLIEIPFDGFIKIMLNVSNYAYIKISVTDVEVYVCQSSTLPTVTAFIPVSQNDVVKVQIVDGEYTGYGSVVLFKNKGNL